MSEHRVTMLGASWRRYEDPTRSRDPRVRAVVSGLATLPAAAPRPEFRDELRAQLVAIAPRIVAEATEARNGLLEVVPRAATAGAARNGRTPRHNDSFLAKLRAVRLGRALTVTATIVTAFVVLLGGAVWMSRSALPGDNLYGLKRASEQFQLATAGSDTERAQDHLDFAATRAREVQALVARRAVPDNGLGSQARVDPDTARLIASTLSSADSDVTEASFLLGNQAVRKGSQTPLAAMTKWAPGQLDRLRSIAAVVPSGGLRDRTESSANLVARALTRAETLAPKVDCSCLKSAGVDKLGPVPCTTCPATGPSGQNPGGSQSGVTGQKTGSAQPGANNGNGSQDPNSISGAPHASTVPNQPAGSGANGTSTTQPGLQLPPIKLPTSSPPINATSCSLGVNLGPIGVGIGLCSLSPSVSLHH